MSQERYACAEFAEEFDRLRRLQGEGPEVMDKIRALCRLRGAHVVELGAGTGVMTERLAAEARWVTAFDRSPHMVAFARQSLQRRGVHNCSLDRAEHSRIQLPEACADLVLSAWALDSVVFDSSSDGWRDALDRVVAEMRRLAKVGGTCLILAAPLRGERDYLSRLERAHGFQRHLFRSPWRFESKKAARDVIRFFLREEVWVDYAPHWPRALAMPAGIWWRPQAQA